MFISLSACTTTHLLNTAKMALCPALIFCFYSEILSVLGRYSLAHPIYSGLQSWHYHTCSITNLFFIILTDLFLFSTMLYPYSFWNIFFLTALSCTLSFQECIYFPIHFVWYPSNRPTGHQFILEQFIPTEPILVLTWCKWIIKIVKYFFLLCSYNFLI